MIQFTDDAVTMAIRAVVAEAGEDYVYPPSLGGKYAQCMYDDEHGGCIAGRAVRKLIPDFQFVELVAIDAHDLASTGVVSHRAVRALQEAQYAQDGGKPWGEALDAFEAAMRP